MNLSLERTEKTALHRQLAESLRQKLECGEIAYGERLPAERFLADELGVSRGTVKKAYETLVAQGYLKAEQGAGTYASFAAPQISKKDQVDILIQDLLKAGCSFNEVEALAKIRVLNIKNSPQRVKIAAVDCNPEALDIIRFQFAAVGDAECMTFLLGDVLEFKAPQDAFEAFDVIFTTATHFEELRHYVPALSEKIVKTVLSTDRDTVVKLAGIKLPDKAAVLTKSSRFAEIVASNLSALALNVPTENFMQTAGFYRSENSLEDFLQGKTHLVIPPLFALDLTQSLEKNVLDFHRQGGELVTFNYAIERGSLFYLEEKIQQKKYK